MAKENTKREAHCPICNEKMKLIEIKRISAMYECSKHGQFIVAFLEFLRTITLFKKEKEAKHE